MMLGDIASETAIAVQKLESEDLQANNSVITITRLESVDDNNTLNNNLK